MAKRSTADFKSGVHTFLSNNQQQPPVEPTAIVPSSISKKSKEVGKPQIPAKIQTAAPLPAETVTPNKPQIDSPSTVSDAQVIESPHLEEGGQQEEPSRANVMEEMYEGKTEADLVTIIPCKRGRKPIGTLPKVSWTVKVDPTVDDLARRVAKAKGMTNSDLCQLAMVQVISEHIRTHGEPPPLVKTPQKVKQLDPWAAKATTSLAEILTIGRG